MIESPIRRLGKKKAILPVLLSHFPKFDIWVEPFAGSGCVGFNVNAKLKFMNDLDDNIFDAFKVFNSKQLKDRLLRYLERVPYSDSVWAYFRKMQPKNIIQKVAKFLILSNWGYMGKPETLRYGSDGTKSKKRLIHLVKKMYLEISKDDYQWANKDFESFLKSLHFRDETEKQKTFLYLDPPYLNTTDTYNTPQWTESDLRRLVKCAVDFGTKFALSEFENEVVLDLAKEYNLNLITLGERQNLKNRQVEILLTNYQTSQNQSLFV